MDMSINSCLAAKRVLLSSAKGEKLQEISVGSAERTQNLNSDLGQTSSHSPTLVPLDPTLECHLVAFALGPVTGLKLKYKGGFFFGSLSGRKKN